MANWYDNILAPVDANGREVPLDTKKLVYKGETREVLLISYNATAVRWEADLADLANMAECPFLSACTLPDSWETLEKDAARTSCEYFGREYNFCKDCEHEGGDCMTAVKLDLVRRAKALAGVGCDV